MVDWGRFAVVSVLRLAFFGALVGICVGITAAAAPALVATVATYAGITGGVLWAGSLAKDVLLTNSGGVETAEDDDYNMYEEDLEPSLVNKVENKVCDLVEEKVDSASRKIEQIKDNHKQKKLKKYQSKKVLDENPKQQTQQDEMSK